MAKTARRTAGLVAVTAAAALGLGAAVASPAQAAASDYVASYRYLSDCQRTGAMYVHYNGAHSYYCSGNYAVGYSLYVQYQV
ncbi:hypothetical protein [Streptomyces sp. NPDC048338]|uniref:hypothetical protein n=1 Tax=Streptomyces sp. NPDC048338 TaxID=3365536 RepID=UPI003718B96C